MSGAKIERFGDDALRIEPAIDADASYMADLLRRLRLLRGVDDAAASERYVMIYFHPDSAPPKAAIAAAVLAAKTEWNRAPQRVLTVSVRYDGVDLAEVADRSRLSVEEVIRLHATQPFYEATMVGFLPGFAYLRPAAGFPFDAPRRTLPRPRVPANAVAIASGYTAIYPFASPGGWNLLGTAIEMQWEGSNRTVPFCGFSEKDSSALRVGDAVRMVVV